MRVRKIISFALGLCQWLLFGLGILLLGSYLIKLIHFMVTCDGSLISGYIWFHRPVVWPIGAYPPWWAYVFPWAVYGGMLCLAFVLRAIRKRMREASRQTGEEAGTAS